VLLVKHSSVLVAFPGATVYELDGDGVPDRGWGELEPARDWAAFVENPPGGCCTTCSTTDG
jgi:predicted ATPase